LQRAPFLESGGTFPWHSTRGTPVSSSICRRLVQAMVNPSGLPPPEGRFD
jgi:hypothetical protein